MKVLHLTLKKEWFDKIASGEKKEEYREHKPYWTKRLVDDSGFYRSFDEIHFKNGYSPLSPFMRVKCGCVFSGYRTLDGKEQLVYVIELKEVLEIRDYSVLWDFGGIWSFWCNRCNTQVGEWQTIDDAHPDKCVVPKHECKKGVKV